MLDSNDLILIFKWTFKIFAWFWTSGLWVPMFGTLLVEQWFGPIAGALWSTVTVPIWFAWKPLRWCIRKATRDDFWTWRGAFLSGGRKGSKPSLKPAENVRTGKPEGVVFGKKGASWVCRKESDKNHVLIFGAPGTGKSQALALPTLACWKGGVLAVDIKGELWEKVGHDQENAMRFSVEDEAAYGFDPFATVYESQKKRHDVARNIALTLIPEQPEEKDKYWTEQSQNLLTAALLTGMEEGFSFVETMEIVCLAGGVKLVEWIAECGPKQAQVYNSSFVDMDTEKTLSSVYSTLHGKVAVFSVDEDVRSCFSREKTVSPSDLRDGAKVYLCLPENKLEQWKNITAMMVKLFLKDAETWENDRKQRTLFMVDEMPRLGKLPAITDSLATLRSKGVCIVLICQSLAQLRVLYGRDETDAIVDLCAVKAILSASGDTAELCSKLVGESVQELRNRGKSNQVLDPTKAGTNAGVSQQWHQVMQPAEFQHLGDDLLVIEPKSGYVRARKMPYWKHKGVYMG